jgi:hypothetical protein
VEQDWYVAAVDGVVAAAGELKVSVDTVLVPLLHARSQRLERVPLAEIVQSLVAAGGRSARLAPASAFAEFEGAMSAYRSRAVRALVEEEGMTFSAVGDLIGVSRQMVARLYKAAARSEDSSTSLT